MLHAVTRGAGPTVLLLHSSGFSSRQWMPLVEQLSVRYSVIAPDLLGYGGNPVIADPQPYDFHDEVDALRELMGDSQAHVVGHSFGGMVALMLARREPQRVRSLALFDPVAFGVLYDAHDPALATFEALDTTPLFRDPRQGGNEDWMRLFIDWWSNGPAWDQLPPPSREGFLRVGRKVFREVMQVTRDRTPRSAYTTLDMPTLLMTGELTPISAQHVVHILAEIMPNARTKRFDGAGHMGPITHARAVNQAIAEHLASVISPATTDT